jgi:hypothetical protein
MGGLAGLDQSFGQLGAAPSFWDSVNHLQATLSLVSLRRSEGEDCQCHRRAEGKRTGDDDEKHNTYKEHKECHGTQFQDAVSWYSQAPIFDSNY